METLTTGTNNIYLLLAIRKSLQFDKYLRETLKIRLWYFISFLLQNILSKSVEDGGN